MFCQIKLDNAGKSRGFGRVRFESPDQAHMAIQRFDGMEYEGRKIEVKMDDNNF